MAKIITQLGINLPGDLEGVTEENFKRYVNWQKDSREVSKRIVNPFRKALADATGFDDDNRPEGPVSTLIDIGENIRFVVVTKPTTKSPAYSEVNESLRGYLGVLQYQHSKGIRRKDILTVNDEPYVAVEDLLEKIGKDIESKQRGKEGVEHKVMLLEPEELVEDTPDSIALVLGDDYSKLTDYHARVYEGAKKFLKKGDEQADAYKKLILDDSLAVLGGRPDVVVALAYAFADCTFEHQLEPRTSPKHREILDALIKERPKRFTTRSKFGDLIKAQMLVDKDDAEILEKKGLVDDNFRKLYKPIRRGEKVYIRLDGLVDKLDFYMVNIASHPLEQNVYMRPGVST